MKFSKENLEELHSLLGEMALKGYVLPIGRVGVSETVSGVVNLQTDSLQTIYANLQKAIKELEGTDVIAVWSDRKSNPQLGKLQKWERAIYLLIGYRVDQKLKSENKEKTLKLKQEIERLEDEALTPKQKLEKKKKLLAELEEIEE